MEEEKEKKKGSRGGKRAGAGRPPKGNGVLQIRADKRVIATFKQRAAEAQLALGEFLRQLLRL